VLPALSALLAAVLSTASPVDAAEAPTACGYLKSLVPISGGPLFLPSYPTVEPGPLRGVAFVYDNSVATIALVGCGEPVAARRIGDAIVWALDHDRAWHDGRPRNAYAAGPVHDNPVKLGGWWDAKQNRWLEDSYQVSSDSGNAAWAMLALLSLERAVHDNRYRDAALSIGNWVAGRADARGAGGFTGGFSGWEPNPAAVKWKSTEHNVDLTAAFTLLAKATSDQLWFDRAAHASRFVKAMWDDSRSCFAVGTTDDGVTPNRMIAADAELWPLLAIPGEAASHGEAVFRTLDQSLKADAGYTYGDAGHGLWTEGTAQAALVARLLGREEAAEALSAAVAAQRASSGGYYATPAASLDTGFADPASAGVERAYFHLPHLAAAAWAALAEKSYNPFLAEAKLP
jgi:hypothetical protein